MLVSVTLLLGLLTVAVSAGDTQYYKLIAGQHEHVGWVKVSIDGDGVLHVEYEAFDGYCLRETHVHVADSLDGIPQTKKGNPIPGQFASKHDELGCVPDDEHVFVGQWTTPLYIAAHAVVGKPCSCWEETAWGVWCGKMDKFGFPGSNWATYILYPPY
jgi:hypothetical protein